MLRQAQKLHIFYLPVISELFLFYSGPLAFCIRFDYYTVARTFGFFFSPHTPKPIAKINGNVDNTFSLQNAKKGA